MGHPRPSYVIFDLGNVLVHIDPAAFLRSLAIDTPDNRRAYEASVTDIAKRYESGDDSTEQFFTNLDMLFNRRDETSSHLHGGKEYFSPDEFRSAMLSIIGLPIEGMEEVVQRVAAAVPVGLLSNTNPVHFEFCLRTFPVLRHFSSHFLSYQLKAFKPDPKIFARVIAQIAVPPEEILYVDDLAENVAAARDAGFMGYQFTDVKSIEHLFSTLKLL